jgi:hypothetical protein
VSAVDTSRPDGIARRPQFRTHRRHCHSVRRRRQHAVRRTPRLDSRPRRGSAVAGGSWTVGRRRPPCPRPAQGAAAVSATESGRPTSTWPQSRTHGGHCRGARFRGRPWFRARSAQPADIGVQLCDRGRSLRTPATRKQPALWTSATAAWARGHCGSGLLDSRQWNRPLPLACPAGNGTARCDIGQHRHGPTARSVAWCSASNWSASDGSALLTLGASSVPSDRERSHRIVWVINGMIKHVHRSTAGAVAGAEPARSVASTRPSRTRPPVDPADARSESATRRPPPIKLADAELAVIAMAPPYLPG